MNYADEKMIGEKLMYRNRCPICGIWIWIWDGESDYRCGICKARNLLPGDQLVPPPPVEVWVLE